MTFKILRTTEDYKTLMQINETQSVYLFKKDKNLGYFLMTEKDESDKQKQYLIDIMHLVDSVYHLAPSMPSDEIESESREGLEDLITPQEIKGFRFFNHVQ